MKTLLAVVLLLLVVVVAVPMISGTGGERTDKPIEGLPWQIESLPDGRSRVFGLTLATSTFEDARARWGADMKVAVVAAPGEPGLVEAYYEQLSIGPLTGKMILTAEVDPQTVERWRARAAKVEYMESSTRKYTLNAEDRALAQRAPSPPSRSFRPPNSTPRLRFNGSARLPNASAPRSTSSTCFIPPRA